MTHILYKLTLISVIVFSVVNLYVLLSTPKGGVVIVQSDKPKTEGGGDPNVISDAEEGLKVMGYPNQKDLVLKVVNENPTYNAAQVITECLKLLTK